MKLLLCLAMASLPALASTSKEWVPKYQQSKIKNLNDSKLDVNISKDAKLIKTSKKTGKVAKATDDIPDTKLEVLFAKKSKNKKAHLSLLKKESLALKQKAVPTLIKVMKSNKFPDENRWVATYMLGRIMGHRSAPFIAKFSQHPNWMMRLASLKVLLHLNQTKYKGLYARALEDKSLIVRHQALQNIKEMKLDTLAPHVWKMLFNKKNYVGIKGARKRSNIIKDAIRTVGDLKFKKAKPALLKMFKKDKYKDVFPELDYALSKITGSDSPEGPITVKKHYWNRTALKEVTI